MNSWLAEKIGDFAEDAIKNALGVEDKDEDDKKGGFFQKIFDRDNDEEKKRKLREKQKEEEDDKGSFFSKMFDRDHDDDERDKKSGFSGLFSEQEGASAAGGCEGGGEESGGVKGQTVAVSDGDLFNDLMDVAEETSKGK